MIIKIEFGKSSKRCSKSYMLGHEKIKGSPEENELKIIFSEDLSSGKHINKIRGETLQLLKNIRIAFTFLVEGMMREGMICPRLKYTAIIWSPHKLKHIRKLESVQRAATKMIPELQDQFYEERLARMQLPTLEKRRERRDIKKFSFLHRSIRLWNGLEGEVVCVNNVQSFKKKLDESSYGDGTVQA